MGGERKKSKTEAKIRENILKKAERRRFRAIRELKWLKPRHILNRQATIKKIQRDLAIAKRKMTQIMKDQVKNKLTTLQNNNLGNTMRLGSALNKNPDRENANGAIFLNNMIK